MHPNRAPLPAENPAQRHFCGPGPEQAQQRELGGDGADTSDRAETPAGLRRGTPVKLRLGGPAPLHKRARWESGGGDGTSPRTGVAPRRPGSSARGPRAHPDLAAPAAPASRGAVGPARPPPAREPEAPTAVAPRTAPGLRRPDPGSGTPTAQAPPPQPSPPPGDPRTWPAPRLGREAPSGLALPPQRLPGPAGSSFSFRPSRRSRRRLGRARGGADAEPPAIGKGSRPSTRPAPPRAPFRRKRGRAARGPERPLLLLCHRGAAAAPGGGDRSGVAGADPAVGVGAHIPTVAGERQHLRGARGRLRFTASAASQVPGRGGNSPRVRGRAS